MISQQEEALAALDIEIDAAKQASRFSLQKLKNDKH
jgi:hypothetical protein